MRKAALIAIAAVVTATAIAGCTSLYRGMEGNIYEKMSIFSVISVTILAVILVPFLTPPGGSKPRVRYGELIAHAPVQPLTEEELTCHPVYLWDAARSFQKIVFAADGSLYESAIIRANGEDPEVLLSGSWALTPERRLQVTRKVAGSPREYSRISPEACAIPTLMRRHSVYAEAWFLGKYALPLTQIACYGYSASAPPAEKFTASLVSGVSVYWCTYPCMVPVVSDVVALKAELAFGVISFNPDGTLSKSINNPVDGVADYSPSFTGTWQIDAHFGVMYLSVGTHRSEVTLLLRIPERHSIIIGTPSGDEQWFLHPDKARQDLARHLAIAVHLDPGKSGLFL